MVDPTDTFRKLQAELELGRDDDPSLGQIILTEGGNLSVEFEEGVVEPFTEQHQSWNSIEGIGDSGYDVTIEKATISQQRNFSLTRLRPSSVQIFQNREYVPDGDEEVVVDFDTLCFLPQIPPRNQLDVETREVFNQVSEREGRSSDIPEEFEVTYFESDEYDISGVPFSDTTDRRDFIKNQNKPLRTAKIRVKQRIQGDLSHQLDQAEEVALRVLELSQLVQEVRSQRIRRRIVSIGGEPIEEQEFYYEVFNQGGNIAVGSAFRQFPDKVLWANFHDYMNTTYQNYTSRIREDLRLRQVLGSYVDARNPERPVEGKMLSVCSAIELIALWHAREDGCSEKTGPKIEHLVNKLGVETEDLAEEVVPNPSKLTIPDYFWRRARNYVVHGDPEIDWDELMNSYEATFVLLKRVIRNQLLGPKNESFERFYSMSPRPRIEYDD